MSVAGEVPGVNGGAVSSVGASTAGVAPRSVPLQAVSRPRTVISAARRANGAAMGRTTMVARQRRTGAPTTGGHSPLPVPAYLRPPMGVRIDAGTGEAGGGVGIGGRVRAHWWPMTKRKRRGGRVTESPRSAARTPQLTMTRPAPAPAATRGVKRGLVGLRRAVPDSIVKPPYAVTGQPPATRGPAVQSPEIIARMRVAGRLAAEVLLEVGAAVAAGVTTDELDAIAHEAVHRRDGYPSPLNYQRLPQVACARRSTRSSATASPTADRCVDGDIVNLDVTVFHDGVHGDTNATFLRRRRRRRVRQPRARDPRSASYARHRGRAARAPASTTSAGPSRTTPQPHRLGVVREFIGHGIGEQFHGGLQIPHYYDPRAATVLEAGHDLHHRAHDHPRLAGSSRSGTTAGPRSPPTAAAARSSSTPWWSPTTASTSSPSPPTDGRAADLLADL